MLLGSEIRSDLDPNQFIATLCLERSVAAQILGGPAWYHAIGRTVIHLAGVPYRIVMVILLGSRQLLSETFKHPFNEQPRVFGIVLTAMLLDCLQEATSWAEPLFKGIFHSVRSKNSVKLTEAATYAHEDLYPEQMKGLFGWLSLTQISKPVHLMPWGGVCWGMSHWFLAVYHALEQRCPNPEERLRITAQLFENGAPKQAILLQALGGESLDCSGLESLLQKLFLTFLHTPTKESLIIRDETRLASLVKLSARGIHAIPEWHLPRSITPGSYLVRRGYSNNAHEMTYVVLSDQLSYTFDPSVGLVRHEGAAHLQSAASTLGIGKSTESWLIGVQANSTWI